MSLRRETTTNGSVRNTGIVAERTTEVTTLTDAMNGEISVMGAKMKRQTLNVTEIISSVSGLLVVTIEILGTRAVGDHMARVHGVEAKAKASRAKARASPFDLNGMPETLETWILKPKKKAKALVGQCGIATMTTVEIHHKSQLQLLRLRPVGHMTCGKVS